MTDRWDDLGEWLGPRLGATGKVEAKGLGGPAAIGYSAETVVFCAAFDTADGPVERRLVLRSEVADPAIYPADGRYRHRHRDPAPGDGVGQARL